ncbi:MAG: type II secretion system protein [Pseudomonadota bacterium]
MHALRNYGRGQGPKSQRGLTLIELVVVLTILVATGGILVPVINNALTRSHVATCATNFSEVSKMLIAANATLGNFGDNWTTDIFGAGAGAGEPVNNSATNTDGGGGGGGSLQTGLLTTDQVAAINELGIVNVCNHGDPAAVDGYDVTFNSGIDTLGATCLTLDDATPVLILTDVQAAEVFLPATTGSQQYVWLGIDKPWTLLGTLTPEPPVHFGDTEGALPNQAYSRFGAVFLVDDGGVGTGDGSAEFKRVSYNLDGSLFETGDNHIGIQWDEVQGSGI